MPNWQNGKTGGGALVQRINKMPATSENQEKVLKLKETHAEERAARQNDAATMLRLWSLLSNDSGLKDTTIGHRNIL